MCITLRFPISKAEEVISMRIELELERVIGIGNYTLDELRTPSRNPELVRARAEFAKQAHDLGYSLSRIAEILNRHHTTINHYLTAYVPH